MFLLLPPKPVCLYSTLEAGWMPAVLNRSSQTSTQQLFRQHKLSAPSLSSFASAPWAVTLRSEMSPVQKHESILGHSSTVFPSPTLMHSVQWKINTWIGCETNPGIFINYQFSPLNENWLHLIRQHLTSEGVLAYSANATRAVLWPILQLQRKVQLRGCFII